MRTHCGCCVVAGAPSLDMKMETSYASSFKCGHLNNDDLIGPYPDGHYYLTDTWTNKKDYTEVDSHRHDCTSDSGLVNGADTVITKVYNYDITNVREYSASSCDLSFPKSGTQLSSSDRISTLRNLVYHYDATPPGWTIVTTDDSLSTSESADLNLVNGSYVWQPSAIWAFPTSAYFPNHVWDEDTVYTTTTSTETFDLDDSTGDSGGYNNEEGHTCTFTDSNVKTGERVFKRELSNIFTDAMLTTKVEDIIDAQGYSAATNAEIASRAEYHVTVKLYNPDGTRQTDGNGVPLTELTDITSWQGLRAGRIRFQIPDTFTGSWVRIQYTKTFTPETGSVVVTDHEVIWTGPGDILDPATWFTPWVEVDPPATEGVIVVAMKRFQFYHGSRWVGF